MNGSALEDLTLLNLTKDECIPFTKDDAIHIKAIKVTCCIVLMLLSLLGNAAVIAIVVKNKHMRTTTNYLIANMAVSDLLLSSFAVPRELTQIFIGYQGWLIHGPAGAVLCKFVYFFQEISTAVSIQSIVAITLDRYTGVVLPFRDPIITPKRRKFVIALIWLTSMGLHGIYFYMARHQRVDEISICFFSFEPAFDTLRALRINFIILSIVLIAIPLAVITVLYSLILRDLKRKKPIWQKSSSSLLKSRRKENIKIVKNILAIILLFVISVLPLDILGFLFFFVWYKKIPCGMDHLSFAAKFIFYSNASLNPCIYFLLNDRYRQGLRDIFKKSKECFPREGEINDNDIEMNAM
ncbi:hypothetical protein ACROYT_G025983 [Oculina patagonica]